MAARIKVVGWSAILRNGRWASNHQPFQDMLNARLDRDMGEIRGSDPNPEHTLAKMAADAFGGEVEEFDRPAFDESVVY